MGWTEIGVIITLLMSMGTIAAALKARGAADRQTEAQVISVTVEAAEGVVALVNEQLRTLGKRVEKLEESLLKEQGKTASLNMQVGKLRKRIIVLEDFIIDLGHTPPPEQES